MWRLAQQVPTYWLDSFVWIRFLSFFLWSIVTSCNATTVISHQVGSCTWSHCLHMFFFFFGIGYIDHSFPSQLWSNWLDWLMSCHGKNANKVKYQLCDNKTLSNFFVSLSISVFSSICSFLLFWRGLASSASLPPLCSRESRELLNNYWLGC